MDWRSLLLHTIRSYKKLFLPALVYMYTCCCRGVQADLQPSVYKQRWQKDWRFQPAPTFMNLERAWASTLALMGTCTLTILE